MNVSERVFAGAKWIFLFSIAQKIISFALNQFVIASIRPELLGVTSIQLELILSTLLFLSRDGIRIALLRDQRESIEDFRKFVFISWYPFFIVMILSSGLGVLKLFFNIGSFDCRILFQYIIGATIESLGEPWINLNAHAMEFRPALAAESSAVVMKTLSSFFCLTFLDMGIFSFGISQIVYGIVFVIVLIASSDWKDTVAVVKLSGSFHFSGVSMNTAYLALSTTFSSFLKHMLTESDKISLAFLASSYNQGVYALASNYASLVARTVFLPIENSSRVAFAKLSGEVEKENDDVEKRSLEQLWSVLQNSLILVCFVGSVFVFFGINYMNLVVEQLFRSQWKSNELILTLQCYCIYLFFMSLNGITEAFVHGTMRANRTILINSGFIASSVVFVIALFFFIPTWGTSGIVLANIGSMICRISFSFYYISQYFDMHNKASLHRQTSFVFNHLRIRSIILVFVIGFVGWLITWKSSLRRNWGDLRACLEHVLIGGLVGIAYLLVIIGEYTQWNWKSATNLIKKDKSD